jgi:hypothetical protein
VTWKCYSVRRSLTSERTRIGALIGTIGIASLAPLPCASQQASASAGPHAPKLVLVQPPAGTSMPSDRPTVFYRYSSGEPTDPVDDASFQLWMDGVERTSGFRIGNGEAWGSLATTRPLSPGAHLVVARVCSVRGICAAANDVVIAVPTAAAPPDDSRPRSALDQSADSTRKHHNHLRNPLTLLGDLTGTIARLFKH